MNKVGELLSDAGLHHHSASVFIEGLLCLIVLNLNSLFYISVLIDSLKARNVFSQKLKKIVSHEEGIG